MKKFILLLSLFFSTALSAADIAVITLAIGDSYYEKVKLGIENKRIYCEEHGYDFIFTQETLDPSRHPYWQKILLTLKTMENPQYQWVVWVDADTLIMDLSIPLEDFIDKKNNIIIAENDAGINSGVYFIRNCEWSKKFLNSVYARTDCLFHKWPEQQAMALELKNPLFSHLSKIVSPRFFNGLPPELSAPDHNNYHPGDFLVHFANGNQLGILHYLFHKYAPLVTHNTTPLSLDKHLNQKGFYLSPVHSAKNEGYMSDAQKEQFREELKLRPEVESILEIGLNGGHSAANFFRSCKGLKKFVSFDINHHSYTPVAVEYFRLTYPDRFEFIQGDSMKTVPEYSRKFPEQKFDLIYIDGGHSYELCLNDILNCKALAHKNSYVWIDDYGSSIIQQAVATAEQQRIIQKKNVYRTVDKQYGERCWVEVEYRP